MAKERNLFKHITKRRSRTIPLLVHSRPQHHHQGCLFFSVFLPCHLQYVKLSSEAPRWPAQFQVSDVDSSTDIRTERRLQKVVEEITKKTSAYTPKRKWHFLLKRISNISRVHCHIQIEPGKVNTDSEHWSWERWAVLSKQAAGAQLSTLEGSQTFVRAVLKADCESAHTMTDNFEIRAISMKEASCYSGPGQELCGPRNTGMIKAYHQFPSGLCDRLSHGAFNRGYAKSVHSANSQKSYCYFHNWVIKTLQGLLFRGILTRWDLSLPQIDSKNQSEQNSKILSHGGSILNYKSSW